MGHWRRVAIRMGTAGRRGVHRDDSARDRARAQLDRHGGDLRSRPFRGSRRPGAARHPAQRAAVRVHEVQPGVGRRREHVAQPRSAIDSQRSRSRACAACRRSASISTRFTGRSGRPARRTRSRVDRRGLDDADEVERRGEGRVHRRVEFRCRAVEANFAHRDADQPAAAVLDAAPGDRAGDPAVLSRAQHRRDSVLADAVRAC